MQIRHLLTPLLALLLWNCGTNSNSAGFASETTNGESATIQLTGDSVYGKTTLYLIPSDFNPTTDTLDEELIFNSNENGVTTITTPDKGVYNLYAVNSKSGKKAFIEHFIPDTSSTINVSLAPPGNVRVHFKNGNTMVDTTDGCLYFPGYIDFKSLKGNLSKNSDGFSILFDSLPAAISDSLFYSVQGDSDYSQFIGVATIESNKTFDLDAPLLYQFITTLHFDIPSDHIETIVSIGDKLCIGTEAGISTVDESGITNQSITWSEHDESDEVHTILPSPDGSIYYGTDKGVFKMRADSKGNNFTATVLEFTGPVHDLALDSRGALWIASETGVYKTLDGYVKHFTAKKNNLPSDTVNTIVIDTNGTAIGGTNRGLFYLDNSGGKASIVNTTITSALLSDTITTLEVAANNNLWIGTKNGGIIHCTPEYWYSYYSSYEAIYAGASVTDIAISSDGIVWICTDSGYLLHGDRGVWNLFLGQEGIIPGVPINKVTIGSSGNIYCGTKGAGVFVIGPSYNFKLQRICSLNSSENSPGGARCTKVPAP